MPKSKNEFKRQDAVDLDIVSAENRTAVGSLRIKPSSILWKPSREQQYYIISLDKFSEWIKANGKKVVK